MIDYEEIGRSVGELVKEKQEAYGDSFGNSHKILKVLYPNGVKPDQYRDLLCITRIIDKLFRLANNPIYGGESPYRDIMGYSILGYGKTIENNIDRIVDPVIDNINVTND